MLDVLYGVLVGPVKDMAGSPAFLAEVVIGGLAAGLMYSLVALGFVLIYKASGVFNFAQGVMVLFAALTLVGLMERGAPLVWGSNVKKLDVGIPDSSFMVWGVQVNRLELTAAITAAVLVAVMAVFFQRTRIGRALRAVADDHEAALSIGIPLNTIWIVVWSAAGLVAIVAGIMWGAKSGVQFSLSLIALKALPVLILGGFTSVPGAIVGGLIIGAGEKLSEVFLAPVLIKAFDLAGGGIENWFAYMLALVFLL